MKINSLLNHSAPLRLERKYSLSSVLNYNQLLPTLNFSSTFPTRQVNSLYLDTPDLRCYHQSISGSFSRYKIRFRWYGDFFQKSIPVQLEIKYKKGELGGKQLYHLGKTKIKPNQNLSEIKESFFKLLPSHISQTLACFKPTLVTKYNRHYYQADNNPMRLTLDESLTTNNLFTDNRLKNQETNHPFQILELKYLPSTKNHQLVSQLAQNLPLRLDQFSKYTLGIEIG